MFVNICNFKKYASVVLELTNSTGEKMEENELYAVLFPDGCHPNAIGHRLLGEILFESLERKTGKTSEPGRKTG